MKRMNREESIQAINRYTRNRVPCIFVISFDLEKNLVVRADEAAGKGIYFEIGNRSNHSFTFRRREPVLLQKEPVNASLYRSVFNRVQQEIRYGNTYLINLTFPTPIQTNYTLEELFAGSNAPYKLFIPGEFLIFSPERFVGIHQGRISSHPMKGTLRASLPEAEKILRSDKKEDAEHNTIVDLIRNDLSQVARDVKVNRFKYIERVRTHNGELLQMSSEITGLLPGNYYERLGEILFTLLPAGSVTGAPKSRTLEIIRSLESYHRGYYTGIFGYFDGSDLESAVAIRFIEQTGNRLVFKSGGGITHLSEWEQEYNEMLEKVYVPVY